MTNHKISEITERFAMEFCSQLPLKCSLSNGFDHFSRVRNPDPLNTVWIFVKGLHTFLKEQQLFG